MNQSDITKLNSILQKPRFMHSKLLQEWRDEAKVTEEEPKGIRTSSQNSAIHKGCELVANALNDAGLDMRVVLKPTVDIPWDTLSVKNFLFKPIMRKMRHVESTTQLKKTGDITPIWDTMMRFLSEHHHLEYIPFPSNDEKALENLSGYKNADTSHLDQYYQPDIDTTVKF